MRPRPADVATGIAVAAAAAAATMLQGEGAAAIAGAAILGAALGVVRPAPRAAWLIAVGGTLLAATAQSGTLAAVLALTPLHAFWAARSERWAAAVVAGSALGGAWVLGEALGGTLASPAVVITAAAWGAGRALGERERLAAQLAARARELEEERAAHAALTVRYERARIASELHDIVAHAVSVMVVQAGAGQRLAARDPSATAQTFAAIAGAARQAEQDLARLVALLGDPEAIGPAPDVALIEELVERAAGSGIDVALRLEGERDGLPAAVAQAAYHVVQEALTNALRYAAGAAVDVSLRADAETLVIEVHNAPACGERTLAGTGTGTGLRGLRERVAACGGTLEAGPSAGGGWRVRAALPRRAVTLRA